MSELASLRTPPILKIGEVLRRSLTNEDSRKNASNFSTRSFSRARGKRFGFPGPVNPKDKTVDAEGAGAKSKRTVGEIWEEGTDLTRRRLQIGPISLTDTDTVTQTLIPEDIEYTKQEYLLCKKVTPIT